MKLFTSSHLEVQMSADSARPKILIVDDSPDITQILSSFLESDYELAIAESGEAGLERLKTFRPDLVLLDVLMPGMDGYEVCETLKSAPTTKEIPVIFLTSLDDMVDEEKGLQLGAIDYITKPFSETIVRTRVTNQIDLKQHREELEQLSIQDGLTGIPNRRRFDEYIESEWLRATRNKSPISLILTDIDFFKSYNDNYGHTSGDDCICAVARALSSSLNRPADLAARYGGEEFAVVLPETSAGGALTIANLIRESVAALGIVHAHSETASHVTLSVGVATVTPDGSARANDLINQADDCLYNAKRGGKNQVHSIDLS